MVNLNRIDKISNISTGSIGYLCLFFASLASGFVTGISIISNIPLNCNWQFIPLNSSQLEPLGRKWSMILVNIPFAIGWLLLYQCCEVWHIFWGLISLNLAAGLAKATLMSYIGEIWWEMFELISIKSLVFSSASFFINYYYHSYDNDHSDPSVRGLCTAYTNANMAIGSLYFEYIPSMAFNCPDCCDNTFRFRDIIVLCELKSTCMLTCLQKHSLYI